MFSMSIDLVHTDPLLRHLALVLARPPTEIIDGTEEYEAESILDHCKHRNRQDYLVLWKGYPREDATWEPVSHLHNCSALLEEY